VISAITFAGDPPARDGLAKVIRAIAHSFSPDQYGLPIYAALVLLGASVLFLACVWFFKTRAPIGITVALFALMPSYSILTHWFDNEQRNHYFGYWFGHDMFTPPFPGPDGQLTYDPKLRENAMKGPNASLVYPEMTKDTILFGGTDPGRFAPTYMIFCDSFVKPKDKPKVDPNFDRRDVYIITQNALADGTYLEYIRAHYFRSDQYQYDTPFFQEVLRGPEERKDRYETNIIARIAYQLLDKPLISRGASIEKRWRAEGVYPPKEIYTPTPEDSQRCFSEYTQDAAKRMDHDMRYPNEPPQIRPGENVNFTPDGRVQVSGQIAVMTINGLLTKVIFDHNPTNEFFVEESFPLDWMYPHLTPFGIIMKINRQPLPEVTDDIVKRDHEFWSRYSERLIGNWITYDTSVKEIADFAIKTYKRRDFSGFKGDRKFVRDDQAQKAFSKLRSSIAGIYAWRLGMTSSSPTPMQYLAKTDAERTRMLREAEFAFKQAFAFCPYSPEAVFRYVQLLASMNRLDDAIIVAETCQQLDPYNGQVSGLLKQLKGPAHGRSDPMNELRARIIKLENEVRTNPADFQKQLDLASMYAQIQQTDRAAQILDGILNNPNADASVIFTVAQAFAAMRNLPKIETALEKVVKLAPTEPEAWYNLAAIKVALNKPTEAAQNLRRSLDLSAKRLQQNPNAHDLAAEAQKDKTFDAIRNLPQFKDAPN
jgi:tetratricopeptide (TPR) repeat protein